LTTNWVRIWIYILFVIVGSSHLQAVAASFEIRVIATTVEKYFQKVVNDTLAKTTKGKEKYNKEPITWNSTPLENEGVAVAKVNELKAKLGYCKGLHAGSAYWKFISGIINARDVLQTTSGFDRLGKERNVRIYCEDQITEGNRRLMNGTVLKFLQQQELDPGSRRSPGKPNKRAARQARADSQRSANVVKQFNFLIEAENTLVNACRQFLKIQNQEAISKLSDSLNAVLKIHGDSSYAKVLELRLKGLSLDSCDSSEPKKSGEADQ
jgi:hypothetical protein